VNKTFEDADIQTYEEKNKTQMHHSRLFLKIFFLLKAATQLVRQVQQERTEVVRSNKVGQSRLARRHSRNLYHFYELFYDCCFGIDIVVLN